MITFVFYAGDEVCKYVIYSIYNLDLQTSGPEAGF